MREENKSAASKKPVHLFMVGFGTGFPDVLKRLLKDEFSDIVFIEFKTLDEMLADDRFPTLILVDELPCIEVVKRACELRQRFGRVMTAVTFSGRAPSRDCLDVCWGSSSIESFLSMDMRIEVWLAAIGLMLKGGRYVSPSLIEKMIDDRQTNRQAANIQSDHDRGDGKIELLTPREVEVLDLVAMGHQNKIIAADLGLSENTVKLHLHNIIKKLEASNRTEAAACYHRHLSAQE